MSPLKLSTPEQAWTARHRFSRYALAVAVVLIVVALRSLVHPLMGAQSFAVFLAGSIIAAWFGGVGSAILSLVLLHVVHAYWFNDRTIIEPTIESIVTTSAYYLVGIAVGVLSQKRTAAYERAQEQQREALAQRERLRATFACMAEGVLVTDRTGRLTLMNPVAEELTGWNIEEAIGRPAWEIFVALHESGRERAESPIERILHEGRVVQERAALLLVSRTGREVPMAYSAAPVRDQQGQITGVVLVFRDESEQRRVETALRHADQRKDEFLATLAHELRNPLAPISMGLEILSLSGDDPRAAGEVRAMMQRQTQHMVRLIDDLLDVSRITRGKLELRLGQVEVADVIRNAIDATMPLIEEAGQALSVRLPEKPILLYADANRLTQVITNLLNNAAKFTPREGRIELSAEYASGEAAITVSDTGIGIPADRLDSVFEMFTQVHSNGEGRHSGLGIGLCLVKRLIEMHGGRVEAESRGQNLGATFRLRLPVMPQSDSSMRSSGRAGELPLSGKRRVLVVDDNQDALKALSRLVAILGNEVREANDGSEALSVAEQFQPDIVLMDLGMPKMDGFEAARLMRERPWGRDILLVATTGWGQEEDRRRTAAAGFSRHLVKPIELDVLREILATPANSTTFNQHSPISASQEVG
jgi:PAS domain S-box-containing protein